MSKKEKTVLVQARIPVSLFKTLEARTAEELCSMADLVRRAIIFTEENRAKKGKRT
jgi:hypothetical protein